MAKVQIRNRPKRGASNAQTVNLASMLRAKWIEKPLCGDPQGYASSASDALRTVSKACVSVTWIRRFLTSTVPAFLNLPKALVTNAKTNSGTSLSVSPSAYSFPLTANVKQRL
jgi:hypothetical protein